MITDITKIKTGPIWNSGGGASFKDQIKTAKPLGEGVNLKEPLTADMLLIRMKEEITVVLTDIKSIAEFSCSRCLAPFLLDVLIPEAEAHFYEENSKLLTGDFDDFIINTRDLSIDLTEALRQEIILHFPLIPVCSDGCKGLCPECKVNLNNSTHKKDCKKPKILKDTGDDLNTHRPFANLKDIIKK